MRHAPLLSTLLVGFGLAAPLLSTTRAYAAPSPVGLARGWQVAGTGLHLGGYGTQDLTKETGKPWQLTTEDLSLFSNWNVTSRFRVFSELSLEDALIVQAGTGVRTSAAALAFERLYVDYRASEQLTARVGRFLTPVGHWNLIHADPLVWTTSRPIVTDYPFPTYTTGGMIYGAIGPFPRQIDYSLYGGNGDDTPGSPGRNPYDRLYGGRLSYAFGNSKIGFSYAHFAQEIPLVEQNDLLGIDWRWSRGGYAVSSEAIYRFSSLGPAQDERGAFLQGVAPLSSTRLFAVARYEYFCQGSAFPAVHLWVAGLALRVTRTSVLKAEYAWARHNAVGAETGFLASFGILF